MVEQEAKVIHSRSGSSDLGFLWFLMKWWEDVLSGLNNKDCLIGRAQCEQVLGQLMELSLSIPAIIANLKTNCLYVFISFIQFFFFLVKKKFHKIHFVWHKNVYTNLNTKFVKSWKYGYWPIKISIFLVYAFFSLLLSYFLLVLNLVYKDFFVYIFFLSLTSTCQKGLRMKISQCWLNLAHFTYCMYY